jgi:hypothetical protein
MAVTNKQLLDMHKRALDTIRAAIDGLDRESLCWCEPETGQWIAQEVSHLCDTERYWIQQEGIDPQLEVCPEFPSSLEEELQCLGCIERRWVELLPINPGLRFPLFRVCLHALYHLARIAHLRRHQQSDWGLPHWSKPGSWEHAIDPIMHVMLADQPQDVDLPATSGFKSDTLT